MKPIKIFLLLLGIMGFTNTFAQKSNTNIFAVSWEMSFPTNNNYLDKTSFAGGRVEYRKMLCPQFSAGIALSWNSFDQYVGTHTYTDNAGKAVTTDMVRQIYTVPVTAIGHYYPKIKSKYVKPYVGVGVGAQYAEQNSFFNIYELNNYNWGFVVRPEIGTFINFSPNVRGMVTGSYNYATNKNDAFDMSSLKQFGVNVGLAFVF